MTTKRNNQPEQVQLGNSGEVWTIDVYTTPLEEMLEDKNLLKAIANAAKSRKASFNALLDEDGNLRWTTDGGVYSPNALQSSSGSLGTLSVMERGDEDEKGHQEARIATPNYHESAEDRASAVFNLKWLLEHAVTGDSSSLAVSEQTADGTVTPLGTVNDLRQTDPNYRPAPES